MGGKRRGMCRDFAVRYGVIAKDMTHSMREVHLAQQEKERLWKDWCFESQYPRLFPELKDEYKREGDTMVYFGKLGMTPGHFELRMAGGIRLYGLLRKEEVAYIQSLWEAWDALEKEEHPLSPSNVYNKMIQKHGNRFRQHFPLTPYIDPRGGAKKGVYLEEEL